MSITIMHLPSVLDKKGNSDIYPLIGCKHITPMDNKFERHEWQVVISDGVAYRAHTATYYKHKVY